MVPNMLPSVLPRLIRLGHDEHHESVSSPNSPISEGVFRASVSFVLALVILTACSPLPKPAKIVLSDGGSSADFLFQEKNISQFGLRETKRVALTFDDGPDPRVTPALLDLLKSEGVRASFFLVGRSAKNHLDLVARMRAEGHVVGNHSHTHPRLSRADFSQRPESLISEIQQTHIVLEPFFQGQRHIYFRAPFGAWRPEHAQALNAVADLAPYVGPIFWTAGGELKFDSEGRIQSAADWACWSPQNLISVAECADGYMNSIEIYSGGVTLMHDNSTKSVELAAELIRRLKAKGYSFVTLDEIPRLDRYEWTVAQAPTPVPTPVPNPGPTPAVLLPAAP